MSRAATTGRNLWTPGLQGARKPGRAGPASRTLGGDQVEGRQAVRELLRAGRREVREIWMTEGSDPSPILGEIDSLAREAHVPIRLVSARRLESVQGTEAPQGVVAFADALEPALLEHLVLGSPAAAAPERDAEPDAEPDAAAAPAADAEDSDEGAVAEAKLPAEEAAETAPSEPRRPAFLLLVDGVTDPQNLGAILRSAECAGASGVVIPRHRSAHVTPAVTKAAAGAIEYLPIALVAGIPSALQDLEGMGVLTIGLDAKGTSTLFDLDLSDRPVAVVLGAEGKGLAPLARRRCEVLASIPMGGEVESLNVSAAAAVACFEIARQRGSGSAS